MSNLVTPRGCCKPLPPVSAAGQVRQVPAIPGGGAALQPCDPTLFGDFLSNLPVTMLENGDASFFPDGFEGDGLTTGDPDPFTALPWQVAGPQTGGIAGYGYTFSHSETAPGVEWCLGSYIRFVTLTISLEQLVDVDPDPADLSDGFIGIELNGAVIPSVGEVIAGGGNTGVQNGGGLTGPNDSIWRINPQALNETYTLQLTLSNPNDYTLGEIYNMKAALALSVQQSFIIQSLVFDISYHVSDSCVDKGILITRCAEEGNSSGTGPGTSGPDIEIVSSGWICEPSTNTYHRTITPYIDGVPGADQDIDSGVPCSEDPPVDRELSQVELCVGNEIQVQFYESVDGADPVAFGAPVLTGKPCGELTLTDSGIDLADNTASQTFPAPITEVRTWSMLVRGVDPVTVTFLDGNTILVESGDSIDFGDGENLRSIAGITFSTGASSNAMLTYDY